MFQILKQIHPTWYFNLQPGKDHGYFPKSETIQQCDTSLHKDSKFMKEAGAMELAYRANRTGCIDMAYITGMDWWNEVKMPMVDEYRFARKYFHPSRVFLVFIIRIITFNNVFNEISAYFNTRSTKRVSFLNKYPVAAIFDDFQFGLLDNNTFVTVIIPTLNRYTTLENVLHDLEKQNYTNFDVIVIDQSEPFREDFYKKFHLKLQVIRQNEKALWLARNTAIRKATGEFIALSEDDVRIPDDWISNHLKCIEYFKADISNGLFFPSGKNVPAENNFFRFADQFATGNAFLRKDVFRRTGLFDRQFEKQRMGDGEFGLRAYLAGFKAIMNPLAWCEDLKSPTGGLREMGNWDAFRPKSIWSPRPLPSVLYFYRKYFGTKAAIMSLLFNVPPSIVPYRFKRNKILLITGACLSVVLLPLIIFQVIRSWRKASGMLNNSMIETLYDNQ